MASRRLTTVMGELRGFTERVVKKLTLDIVANLVAAPSEGGTPVDTGWARANWVPNIGTPASGPFGSPGAVSGAAQQAGTAAVLGYKLDRGPVYISNGVPYIGRLNDGHSLQAPKGFVQRAIEKAIAEL